MRIWKFYCRFKFAQKINKLLLIIRPVQRVGKERSSTADNSKTWWDLFRAEAFLAVCITCNAIQWTGTHAATLASCSALKCHVSARTALKRNRAIEIRQNTGVLQNLSASRVLFLSVRARLHGKRVPLGDRGTLPSRVEDTFVLHAKFKHGRGTFPSRVKI